MPFAALLLAALCLPAAAQFEDDWAAKYYTIDEDTVKIEDLGPVVVPSEELPDRKTDETGLTLDRIVNIGLKVWQLIKDNQPVSEVKNLYATALPSGAARWDDLGGWKPPTGRIYQLTAKNMYGHQTVLCKFQVLRSWNGSVNGKGKYLTGATVQALKTEVAWGYQFYFDVEVPDSGIINVGDKDHPVAGLTINARWKIHTVMKDSQGRASYWLDGNGTYRELGLPDATSRVARALPKMLESLE